MKTKIKTKILPLLMLAVMAAALLPAHVRAVEENSSDEVSLRGPIPVSGSASDYQHVYYAGNRWRILENSGHDVYLLTEGIVINWRFGDILDSYIMSAPDGYCTLDGGFIDNFSAVERSALHAIGGGPKVYLLSLNEIYNGAYFPGGDVDRALGSDWWLRSAGVFSWSGEPTPVFHGITVNTGGGLNIAVPVADAHGIRPACRVGLDSILFTADAAGGAPAVVGSALSAVSAPAGDLKLTLVDSSQTVTVGDVTCDSWSAGGTVTVSYSGAATSGSNYLCAELISGGITYRGVLSALTAGNDSGTATLTLPCDLTANYTLRLWNEKFSAANTTNYSCTPITKTMTLPDRPDCGGGAYFIKSDGDAAYTAGYTGDGIPTLTVNAGVTGFTYFGVSIDPATGHAGTETAVFVQTRDGQQLAVNATTADFDSVGAAKVGFNVKAGDVIAVYIVDSLTNSGAVSTTVL